MFHYILNFHLPLEVCVFHRKLTQKTTETLSGHMTFFFCLVCALLLLNRVHVLLVSAHLVKHVEGDSIYYKGNNR